MTQDADKTVTSLPRWTYPQDPHDCPPDTARPVSAVYFRVVASVPPTEADFWPVLKKQPNRPKPNERCQAAGLSVFSERLDAQRVVATVPAFKGQFVVAVKVEIQDGVVERTPSRSSTHHYTWWPAAETDCRALVIDGSMEA